MADNEAQKKQTKTFAQTLKRAIWIFLILSVIVIIIKLVFAFMLWGGNTDYCLTGAPSPDTQTNTVKVYPGNGQWQNAGVTVKNGDHLKIDVSGLISLCKGTRNPGDSMEVFKPFSPQNPKWIATGAYVRKGSPVTFNIRGAYSQFADDSCGDDLDPSHAWYTDNTTHAHTTTASNATRVPSTGRWDDHNSTVTPCYSRFGKGLFVSIGEPDGGLDSNEFPNPLYEGAGDTFFELYDYRAPDSTNFLPNDSGKVTLASAPASGQIYLRYGELSRPQNYDAVTSNNTSSGHWGNSDADYADNRDGYQVKIESHCEGTNGQYLKLIYFNPSGGKSAPDFCATGSGKGIDFTKLLNLGHYDDVAKGDGTLFVKVVDTGDANADTCSTSGSSKEEPTGDGNYGNNSGSYLMNITTIRDHNTDWINGIIKPVDILLHGKHDSNGNVTQISAPEAFFRAITGNLMFVRAIQAIMVLAIAFYGFTYLAQGKGGTLQELLMLTFKLAIMVALIDPNSWDFFYNYLFRFFVEGMGELTNLMAGAFNTSHLADQNITSSDTVKSVFLVLSQLSSFVLNIDMLWRILALMFTSIFYFGLSLALALSLILIILATLRALITYLLAMVYLSLMLGMAPIFLSFMLFGYTFKIFNYWLRATLDFALRPVLLIALLNMFAVILLSMLQTLFHTPVCLECTTMLKFGTWLQNLTHAPGLGPLDFCIQANFVNWSFDHGSDLQIIVTSLSFLCLSLGFHSLGDFVTRLSGRLSGAPGLASGLDPWDTFKSLRSEGLKGLTGAGGGLASGAMKGWGKK